MGQQTNQIKKAHEKDPDRPETVGRLSVPCRVDSRITLVVLLIPLFSRHQRQTGKALASPITPCRAMGRRQDEVTRCCCRGVEGACALVQGCWQGPRADCTQLRVTCVFLEVSLLS